MRIRLLLLATALVLASVGAHAQTLHFLGDLDTDITSLPAEPTSSCFFGNLRTPGALESFGVDILSFHAEIDSIACGCDGGWMVSEVHLLLANPTDGPVGLGVQLCVDGQGWATYPSGCLEPHPGYFGELSNWYSNILLPEPGYYELIVTSSSPCAFFCYEYFLKCFAWNDMDARLVVDADGARECEVLEGVHMGMHWWWVDPHYTYENPWQLTSGAPIWWVEAACCETPVAAESRSWSNVKSLYR